LSGFCVFRSAHFEPKFILTGDVVTAVDDIEIISGKQLVDTLVDLAGKEVTGTLLREGEEKKLKVKMGPKS
jgi:S1-C subfamily serine protease